MAPAERLFATESVGCTKALHRLHAATVLAGIWLALCYRAAQVPAAGGSKAVWLGMLGAELWFGLYWIVTQSVRWSPVRRRTFKDRLAARFPYPIDRIEHYTHVHSQVQYSWHK
jgi:hypothetical protein